MRYGESCGLGVMDGKAGLYDANVLSLGVNIVSKIVTLSLFTPCVSLARWSLVPFPVRDGHWVSVATEGRRAAGGAHARGLQVALAFGQPRRPRCGETIPRVHGMASKVRRSIEATYSRQQGVICAAWLHPRRHHDKRSDRLMTDDTLAARPAAALPRQRFLGAMGHV